MKRYPLLLLFIAVLQYHAFARDIHFLEQSKNELPSLVTGMSLDPGGYLWITGTGLHRYNGVQFQSYHHNADANSFVSNRTECVFADKDTTVWVGTFADLYHFDPATGVFKHYRHDPKDPSSIACDTVIAIIRGRTWTLWIGTNAGLEKFDPATGKFVNHAHHAKDPGSLSNNQVRIIYEDKAGTICMGCGSVFPGESPKGEGEGAWGEYTG